jgi:hypothetical protein
MPSLGGSTSWSPITGMVNYPEDETVGPVDIVGGISSFSKKIRTDAIRKMTDEMILMRNIFCMDLYQSKTSEIHVNDILRIAAVQRLDVVEQDCFLGTSIPG